MGDSEREKEMRRVSTHREIDGGKGGGGGGDGGGGEEEWQPTPGKRRLTGCSEY